MLHDDIDKLIDYANEILRAAEQEASRSHEDVVTYVICSNARQSIANFLGGFIVRQGETVLKPVTIQSLLDQCKELDARFESVDITPIHCRCETHENDYCLEHDQVDECMRIAQQTRDIVMSTTPGY